MILRGEIKVLSKKTGPSATVMQNIQFLVVV